MQESFSSGVTVWTTQSATLCGRIGVNWRTTIGGVNGMSVARTDQGGRTVNAVPPIAALSNPWTDTGMTCNVGYIYTVNVYTNGRWRGSGQSSQTLLMSCCTRHASSAFIQEKSGNLDVLVPFGAAIDEFTHETSVVDQQLWKHVHKLGPLPHMPGIRGVAVSLIQSASGKFEAIAREGHFGPIRQGEFFGLLAAYETDPGAAWQGPVAVVANDGTIDRVTGTPAIIQTDYDNQGKFELLVPREGAIDHYVRADGTILQGPWNHVHRLNFPADDPVIQVTSISFMQSSSGMLEAVARATPQATPVPVETQGYLLAYELDPISEFSPAPQVIAKTEYDSVTQTSEYSSVPEVDPLTETSQVNPDAAVAWQGPIRLAANDGPIDKVTGSPALTQSVNGGQVQFELLAPRGIVLDHYTLESGSILQGQWNHAHSLMPPGDDPQALFTAAWLIQDTSGKLEAVARLKPPQVTESEYLVGYEFDLATGWQGPVRLVSDDGPIHGGISPL
jgi:hypothetical protein